MEDIILLGLGGHAHSVVDSIERAGKYNIVGFLDKEEMQGKHFRDYQVLGLDNAMQEYFDKGIQNAFITIGFMGYGDIRNRLYKQLKDVGYTIPNIIDSAAIISKDVVFEEGIFIGKNAVINANVHIGKMSIINTGAIVEHDCQIGSFSHIAVGGVVCGEVLVGEQTLIGANATVLQERIIGSYCIVGAGAVVTKDVVSRTTVVGALAKVIT